MNKNLHDIDKLFKTALDNQEENPSKGVWDNIDKNLDKNKVVDISRKYFQLRRVAIVMLVLLLGAGIYTFTKWKTPDELANNDDQKIHSQSKSVISLPPAETERNKVITPNPVNTFEKYDTI
ncbi:MAG: hypothetical protein ABIS01_01745, partial [Ferruginibacter sp.]